MNHRKSTWIQTWHNAAANKLTLEQGTFLLPCIGISKRSTKLSDVRTWQIHQPSCLQASFPSALDVVYHVWRTALQLSPQIACRLRFRPQSVWLWQYGSTSCMLWSAKQFGWKKNCSGRTGHQETSTSTIHCHMRHIYDLIWCEDNSPTIHSLHFERILSTISIQHCKARLRSMPPGRATPSCEQHCHKKCQELQQIEEHCTNVRTTMRAKLCQIEICSFTFCHLMPFTQAFSFCSRSVCPFLLPTLLFGSWCRLRCPSERHLWRRDRTYQSADFKAGEFALTIGLITSKS